MGSAPDKHCGHDEPDESGGRDIDESEENIAIDRDVEAMKCLYCGWRELPRCAGSDSAGGLQLHRIRWQAGNEDKQSE
jgi:hypothetical protein